MIDKRRWPNAIPRAASAQMPSSSGPRWRKLVAIRCAIAHSSSCPLLDDVSRNPVIPHIEYCSDFLGLSVHRRSDFFCATQVGRSTPRISAPHTLQKHILGFIAELSDREIFQDALPCSKVQRLESELLQQSRCELLGIVRRYNDPRLTHDQSRIAYVCYHTLPAASHCLSDDVRKPFAQP